MVNLVYLCFVVSVVLSSWHLSEEYKGRLWRYFGAIAGVRVSDTAGKLVFTGGLSISLLLAAVLLLRIADESSGLGVLGAGFLLGGRVSDWWNSHYRKFRAGYKWPVGFRGNPGLLSSWFYLADSALLIYLLLTFEETCRAKPLWLASGLLAGTVTFVVVIPLIRLVGKLFPSLKEPPWQPPASPPNWAIT
jgi:hypothetical protein